MRGALNLLLVFTGGALGALLRVLLLAIPLPVIAVGTTGPAEEALGLAVINVVGAFALGWLTAVVSPASHGGRQVQLLVGTGLLGGFTSYSSLVLLALPFGGAFLVGLAFAVVSLIAGVVAAALGLRLGRRGSTGSLQDRARA